MLLFFTPAEQQCKWLVQSMPRHMKDTKLILVNIISFVLLFDYHYPVFIYSANTFQVHHQSWCNNLVVSLNTQINFSASPSNVATSAVVIHMTTRRIKFFFFFFDRKHVTRDCWWYMYVNQTKGHSNLCSSCPRDQLQVTTHRLVANSSWMLEIFAKKNTFSYSHWCSSHLGLCYPLQVQLCWYCSL